jgi:hypothetical protein
LELISLKKSTEVRSDHLLAIINCVYELAASDQLDVLDMYGDNEQGLDSDEQLEYIQQLKQNIERLVMNGHCELTISK